MLTRKMSLKHFVCVFLCDPGCVRLKGIYEYKSMLLVLRCDSCLSLLQALA